MQALLHDAAQDERWQISVSMGTHYHSMTCLEATSLTIYWKNSCDSHTSWRCAREPWPLG